MQKRLLACLLGGLLGAAVASPVNAGLGLSLTVALVGCSAIGVALGYVASVLFEVFTTNPVDEN